jgi:multiple sugar transport system permease protein/raffinose/stachyose/melibiose transport system permease protein
MLHVRAPRGFFTTILLLFLLLLTLYPFFFMVMTAFKDNAQFTYQFWWFAAPLHWEYLASATDAMWHYVLNSALVAAGTIVGVLTTSTLAAYAFARFTFWGREVWYYSIIAMLMVPYILTLIPTFVLVKNLGLLNSYWGLILPYIAGGEVLAIFIMRAFFAGLPNELFEAARVDGASHLQGFLSIALPLTKPVLGTIAIVNLVSVWNDYVWPLLVIGDDSMRTLTLGLTAYTTRHQTLWGPLMSGYAIGALPLLLVFLISMRYFIQGLTAGALKL